ncbi:DUF4226 domain-containing protein [Mycobacterium sp. 94-17]|uniref:DUF4226 domain-containing protein n=1 Tax=Mycobacterium sp. 94-17 TaxID=2986147 RepID=UPI002D1EC6D5|nr:DUF4226 domain-containing protein [Mycobacterium sp. 94-17]MEB4209263.1 DUF4226 domain-containing protein [Mycobacterium sp. 94-17]
MPEQPEPPLEAVEARRSTLAGQRDAASEADRMLIDVLTSAHDAARAGVRRLDAIAEEIERATVNQADLAIDTPMGAREFRKFLVAKQREIASVVAEAREFGQAKSAVLQSLQDQYAPDGD